MFTYTSTDGLTIHVHTWTSNRPRVRGIVQIAHGMGEHGARYAHLADKLAEAGYAVYAADQRGHGHSIVGTPGDLGPDGWNMFVADMVALTEILRERHPGVPLVLLAHSLGAMAAQQYLLDHAELLDGVALSGATAVDGLFENIAAAGGDLLGYFNARFQPTRTDADWISRDEAQVDAYIADPWCGFAIDEASMAALAASGADRLAKPTPVPANLPFYIMVGAEDPLNDTVTLSDLAVRRFRDAGATDITYRVYPGARHELLNEIDREDVEDDLITWFERVTG